MRTFTLKIDSNLEDVLDQLKKDLGKTSRADVFRLAIALLKISVDGKKNGLRIVTANKNNEIEQEIVLP